MQLEKIIETLGLVSLEKEGGLVSSPIRAKEIIHGGSYIGIDEDRSIYSTIYYLLTKNAFSTMHKLKQDEIWYYHYGSSLKMLLIYPDGHYEIKILGMNLEKGELPKIVVEKNVYQGTLSLQQDEYTLVSTSLSPSYDDSDFTIGDYDELKKYLKEEDLPLLMQLTSEIVYK